MKEKNFAFIDGNNLHLGTTLVDKWEINYAKLREYLSSKYSITKAYYFIGYIPYQFSYRNLYRSLLKAGFILKLSYYSASHYSK